MARERMIHGPSTRLRNPTRVALDLKNKEVWVSNLGNSSATVYPLMAGGDVAPLRVIRSAEESKRGLSFGRTSAVAYDPIRREILVPSLAATQRLRLFELIEDLADDLLVVFLKLEPLAKSTFVDVAAALALFPIAEVVVVELLAK